MVKKKDKSEREREGRGKMSSMQFKKRGREGKRQMQRVNRDGVTIKREKRLKDTEVKRQLEKDRQEGMKDGKNNKSSELNDKTGH